MKKLVYMIPAVALAFSMMTTVNAEHYPVNGKEWNVTFNGNGDPVDDFTNASFTDVIQDMQPGDDATFVINLNNTYKDSTKWWMTNTVLDSFEDNSIANGGAYTYRLVYYGPGDSAGTTLYDSMTVGGEDSTGTGLHEATNALGDESQNGRDNSQREDYIELGDIGSGQSGRVVLDIELDGETQGNAYQDTLADLRMNFALELESQNTPPGTPPRRPPNTSDPLSMVPWLIATGVSGLVLLLIAIIRIRDAKEEEA